MRKRWGQHFLSDKNLLLKLVRIIDPGPEDSILEIGPGGGALTELLAPRVKQLVGVEIDPELFNVLVSNPVLAGCTFLNQDFLEVDLSSLPISGNRLRVVGNIPYRISSPIIFKLLEVPSSWWDIHLMVQKEVADRLAASPGNKTYGRLTVMVQTFMEVSQVLNVPPDVFVPKPKVYSAVVALSGHSKYALAERSLQVLADVVRKAFSQRRKMLKNSLSEFLPYLGELEELDLSRRPEMLSVDEFVHIARHLSKNA